MNYNNKDFTSQNLQKHIIEQDVIEGSCFSQELPNTKVFPDGMTGKTFIDCNLDNCFIPDGNTVIGGSQRLFKVQNDLNDWEVNDAEEPVKILNEGIFLKLGLEPPTPEDIPEFFIREELHLKHDYEKEKDTDQFKSWFINPQIVEEKKKSQIVVSVERWAEMAQQNNFYPFDTKPFYTEVFQDKHKCVALTGELNYVRITGKGKIGSRSSENKPIDWLALAQEGQ